MTKPLYIHHTHTKQSTHTITTTITTIVNYIQHKYNTKTNKNNYEFNNISLAALENSLKDVFCFKLDDNIRIPGSMPKKCRVCRLAVHTANVKELRNPLGV